ncbi:hypothetical protein Sjap_026529 [Stephania japonica]|uniref:Uncharacterized protein n=1 Tax=Stephania japonica TaxID=461633 RepID=A0AAP0E6W7_9MAGN
MASAAAACAISSEKFLECSPSAFSFAIANKPRAPPAEAKKDIEVSRNDMGDFEFRLVDHPVAMLPADELFSDGKLLPLRFGEIRIAGRRRGDDSTSSSSAEMESVSAAAAAAASSSDLYVFSPKAPRCSSSLREILGLKKVQKQNSNNKTEHKDVVLRKNHSYLMKYLVHRNNNNNNKSSSDQLPLLKEEELVVSSSSSSSSARLSLSSSSSSGLDHEDLPNRLSLDSDRLTNVNPPKIHTRLGRSKNGSKTNPNLKVGRARGGGGGGRVCCSASPEQNNGRIGRSPIRRGGDSESCSTECTRIRAFSVDSPRMNSSGKVVFHNLGRSSSSPSSFNGGQQTKMKGRGMERSYSSNFMVTPVLNVPVCSVFGLFPTSSSSSTTTSSSSSSASFSYTQQQLQQQQRKSSSGDGAHGSLRDQMKRNRTDRVC